MANEYKIGKAYGFLDYNGPKGLLERELEDIRLSPDFQVPSALELSLTEGVEGIEGDLGLMGIALGARGAGMTYVLEARYPNATNEQAAAEISSIFQQISQSPLDNGSNRYGIVYEENGDYTFMR